MKVVNELYLDKDWNPVPKTKAYMARFETEEGEIIFAFPEEEQETTEKHLPGKHPQKSHAGGRSTSNWASGKQNSELVVHLTDEALHDTSANYANVKIGVVEDGTKVVVKFEDEDSYKPKDELSDEVHAYNVAKELGMDDIIPKSVQRQVNGRDAVVQEFVDGVPMARGGIPNVKDAKRLALYDALIGNNDRHRNNVIVQNGKPIGIDNTIGFGRDYKNYMKSNDTGTIVNHMQRLGKPLHFTSEDYEPFKKLNNSQYVKDLRARDTYHAGIDRMLIRLESMSKVGEVAIKESITHKHLPGKHPQKSHAGGRGSSSSKVWDGQPVEWEGKKLTKLQVGEIGEQLAMKVLSDKLGTDFHTLNEGMNNAPIDVGGDHRAVEVKTGLASNGKTAQHWRATIGQPGKQETALIRQMNREEKRAHNAYKRTQILKRKQTMLEQLSEAAGAEVKGMTVGIILHPNGKQADVYQFEGFHLRIPWNKATEMGEYLGTHEV